MMSSKKENVYLRSSEDVQAHVKLSIMKDGRAALSTGWRDLAMATNLSDGTIVAFTFKLLPDDDGIDLKVVALKLGN